MDLKAIQALISDDMATANKEIIAQLDSDVALINQLSFYIVSAGGKRLRPMLAILAAKATGYEGDQHAKAAAIIEFLHTATLLHDDVVDESDLRRGRPTANAEFGNAASVLVGDYIYTRSFQMMVKLGSMKILDLMSEAVNVIAEGEVQQLINCNDPNISEDIYMEVIYSKTARLFEVATQIGAVVNDQSIEIENALKEYGRYVGTAFQIIDDLLDYDADQEQLGKTLGDDLAEGKPTLPLLHAMQHSTAEEANLIRSIIEKGDGRDHLDAVLAIMKQVGSLEYTQEKAEEEADKAIQALAILPDTPYKEALISLADIAVKRSS